MSSAFVMAEVGGVGKGPRESGRAVVGSLGAKLGRSLSETKQGHIGLLGYSREIANEHMDSGIQVVEVIAALFPVCAGSPQPTSAAARFLRQFVQVDLHC